MAIFVPEPFADELAKGFLGRFGAVNGYKFVQAKSRSLALSGGLPWKMISAETLARLCGNDFLVFVAKHTMLPLLRAITKREGPSLEEHSGKYSYALPHGVRARACRACIERDEGDVSVAYWHRLHHITGVDWCVIHDEPLQRSPLDMVFTLPSCTSLERIADDEIIYEEMQNPVLQRLQAIQRHWLAAGQSIHPVVACEVLKARCAELDLRSSQVGKRKLISDFARAMLPHSWLLRHFPDLAAKADREYFCPVDGPACDRHVAYPSFAYAVAFAVIFDSAKDALSAIDRESYKRITVMGRADEGKFLPEDLLYGQLPGKNMPLVAQLGNEEKLSVTQAVCSFSHGMTFAAACRIHGVRRRDLEVAIRLKLSNCPPCEA